jgi:hypothetical protein
MRVAIGSDHAGFEMKNCTINLPSGPTSLIGMKRMAAGSPLRRSFLRRSHDFCHSSARAPRNTGRSAARSVLGASGSVPGRVFSRRITQQIGF